FTMGHLSMPAWDNLSKITVRILLSQTNPDHPAFASTTPPNTHSEPRAGDGGHPSGETGSGVSRLSAGKENITGGQRDRQTPETF
ncbi:hypothetical protein, partial [Protofrankia symbiont of Coriaria ruscifolia]|uniref:hypothetical protein n=1 Tax=Protofrankia symbiont of Coriaria ruscifolia TaxID=1306542 RepID=UPI001A948B5F